jgi:hypothetical protein
MVLLKNILSPKKSLFIKLFKVHSHIDVFIFVFIPFVIQPFSHKEILGKNNLNLSFKGISFPSIGDLK